MLEPRKKYGLSLVRSIVVSTVLLALCISLGPQRAKADIVPGTVSTDPFDSTQGTVIVGHDAIIDPINVFRTNGGFEDGHTLMRNGVLTSVSFINFDTPVPVSIIGVRLFAHNDQDGCCLRRAMSNFKLFADTDGDAIYETTVVNQAINPAYNSQMGNMAVGIGDLDFTLMASGIITAQHWRLEVMQGSDIQPYEGARIVELDAIPAYSPPPPIFIYPPLSTQAVSTDLFDSTQGTVIVDHDTIVDPINVFRTNGGFEDGNTLMRNGGLNSVSYINFDTPTPVSISGVRLLAHNDLDGCCLRRAMNNFRLLADTDGDAIFETMVVNQIIEPYYNYQLGNAAMGIGDLDLTLMANGVITAQHWRLEVTQGSDIQPYEGARIVELDAIPAPPPVAAVPAPVSDDPFDATLGTVVVDHDTIVDPINAFRTSGGFEDGHTLMRNGGLNSVSYINFDTPSAVSISGVRLFAHNDMPGCCLRRAMNNFKLLADTDGDAVFETTVVNQVIDPYYNSQSGNQSYDIGDLVMTLLANSVITAQHWRLEVTQGSDLQPYEGARLIELDAIPASVVTAPSTRYVDVAAGLIYDNAHAQQICPSVCTSAGGTWSGQWTNIVYPSVCGCWLP